MTEDYRTAPRYRIARAKSDLDVAYMHVASYTDDANLREARIRVRDASLLLVAELEAAIATTGEAVS